MSISTPHMEVARKNDFAKTVIMPGDPKRAEWIAKTFLTDIKSVTSVRGNLGFTGMYKGKRVSVMSSGMGNPSMGIYSYELFNLCNVKNIIRVGTCGTYEKDFNLGDIIVAKKVITNTNYCDMLQKNITKINASKELFKKTLESSKNINTKIICGNIFCTDTFYGDKTEKDFMIKNNCIGMEMESAALYYNAKVFKKNAITICSVCDNLTTKQHLSSIERTKSLKNMILFALSLI